MNRGRRTRRNENVRRMVRETRLSKDSLIYPLFLEEGSDIKAHIDAIKTYGLSPVHRKSFCKHFTVA